MTSTGGWRPRSGLAVALAAAAIVAVGLQASALANGTDKERRTAEEKKPARQHSGATTAGTTAATAPKPTQTQTQTPVTRTIGSVTVTVDPATGRLRPPTAEEAAQLAAILGTMTSREVDQVPVMTQPDGAQMAILGEGFEEVAMASKDGKKLSLYCVNTKGQTEKILAGGVKGGPDYNTRPNAADRKGGKGGKGSSNSGEKE
jgi:hypothetical protein